MTGRVCQVHGEWSATGVCRWCEPAPTKPMHPNVPPGSTPCYCGKYAWAPWCHEERNTVLAGVAHSPERCFGLVGESPGASALRDAAELAQYLALFPAAQEHLLALEHAALRWERVARKWNYKHRTAGGFDEAGRAYVWMHWLDQMERRYAYLTWTPRQPP